MHANLCRNFNIDINNRHNVIRIINHNFYKASTHTHARKTNFTLPKKNQTIDGIALNKAERSSSTSSADVPDGPERMPTEAPEMFSSTVLNQFEISSDDESLAGAARSRPVRAVAKKRKTKVVAKAKGKKQQIEEMDDVFIE